MDRDDLVKTLRDALDPTTLTHYGRKGMKWYQHIFGSDRKGGGSRGRASGTLRKRYTAATRAGARAASAKDAYKSARRAAKRAKVERRTVREHYGPVFGRQHRIQMKERQQAAKRAAKAARTTYKSAKRESKLSDKQLQSAIKEWQRRQKKKRTSARHSMPADGSLTHYGVKGSKWGYNKGRKNGKRTAGLESQLTDKALNSVTALNERIADYLSGGKVSRQKSARASSDALSKGHAELDRRRRVREATAAAVARAKQRKQSQNNRRNANSKDARDNTLARKASAAATRKKRNRQLNRIDGLKVGSKATNRQIAMYYDRRNRKNLKNA